FRSRTRDLYICDDLCGLGCCLSLPRVARQAAHKSLLGTRLATVSRARNLKERSTRSHPGSAKPCGTAIHSPPLRVALVDASASLLGLHPRRPDHLPVGLRLDLLPAISERPEHLRHSGLRFYRDALPSSSP